MSRLLAAADRLALSRERLRADLHAGATLRQQRVPAGPAWLAPLRRLPGADILIDALLDGWSRSPLRGVARVAADVGRAALQPLARHHPWRLVVGAMLAGALLERVRPWRWALRSALASGLGTQLLAGVIARLPRQR